MIFFGILTFGILSLWFGHSRTMREFKVPILDRKNTFSTAVAFVLGHSVWPDNRGYVREDNSYLNAKRIKIFMHVTTCNLFQRSRRRLQWHGNTWWSISKLRNNILRSLIKTAGTINQQKLKIMIMNNFVSYVTTSKDHPIIM